VQRAIILATVFLIDFLYFETTGNGGGDGGFLNIS
jgi:hypothetical protein